VRNSKDLIYKKYTKPNNKIFTLIYIGGMKRKRYFPWILDIIKETNTKLILAGKKEDMFFEMQEISKKYDCVEFLGTIPMKDIIPMTHKADATFIIVNPKSPHYQRTLFNKQFEAMVCGRPIITTRKTFAGKMTENLKCGLTVDYNRKSMKKAIITLRDNPKLCEELGKNALKAAIEKYNWEAEKQKLVKVYKELE